MQHKNVIRGLLGLCIALAAPVQAQVTGVVTKSSATTTLVSVGGTPFTLDLAFQGTDIGIASGYDAIGGGSTFSATSQLDPDYVAFRNGNVSSGLYAVTTSHTIIDISFTNDGSEAVRPLLMSTILPAGLGMFIDGVNCLNGLTGCAPGDPVTNPATFQDFLPSGANGGALGNTLAGAQFDFKVTGGGELLYDLAGGVTLLRDLAAQTNMLVADLDAAAAALNGFQIQSPAGSDQQFAANWEATAFQVDFGLGTLLAPGQSSTLRYETTVTSFTQVECLTDPSDACLIAYSAFGDPIGRGGGVDPSAAFFSAFFAPLISTPSLVREFTPSDDDLLSFGSFNFNRPVFRDGILYFELAGGVPEPATWTMLICGFALAGGALRRRALVLPVRVG